MEEDYSFFINVLNSQLASRSVEEIQDIVEVMMEMYFCDDIVFDDVCLIELKCGVSVYKALLLYYFAIVEKCDIEKFW